ncbi:family 43 glycosylhydrolase [Echinicola sediminis]
MLRPILFLCIAFLVACSTKEVKEQMTIQNPVIQGEFPDPSVIKVGDDYYACGTSNDWAPIYPIYTSKDLVNWSFISYVFMEAPDWTVSSFWAPELYYKDGTFYCYYTARRKDGISCIGVATSKDINSGFTDHGVLIEWGSESIDAFVNEVEGQLYVTWKAYGLNPDKPIQILGSKLSADGLKLEGKAFEVVTAEAESWERGGIEGQSIIKNGDYFYMLYSGAACCGGGCDYKVGVARAKEMEGPWEKYSGNPILTDFGAWKCPGHGTPVSTDQGGWYYLYHAYAKDGFPYMGRSALLSSFYWDEEKGWPYFKVNELMQADHAAQVEGINDRFEEGELNQWWRWDLASYTPEVKIENGELWLSGQSKDDSKSSGVGLNVIPLKADYKVEIALESQEEVMKGLGIYGTSDNQIVLGLKDGALVLFELRNGVYKELGKSELPRSATVRLKAEVKEGHKVQFSYQTAEDKWQQVIVDGESAEITGDFLSFWQWGVKPGLFVANGQQGSFDEFKLSY